MFESIYVGQTGLLSFSRNLTVIGNNVANMNTSGFKSTQLSFSDLAYRMLFSDSNDGAGAGLQLGSGVGTGATRVLFTQGSMHDTGNPTDLAVDGSGFFILRNDAGTFYTRNGEFEFDETGALKARANGARVAALDGARLVDFSVAAQRGMPGQPSSIVRLVDNLAVDDTTHSLNVTVYQSAGGAMPLTLAFTKDAVNVADRRWTFEVRDQAGATLSSGEVQFSGDGSPKAGFNKHVFTLTPPGGVAPSTITIDFGEPGSFSGATNFTGTESKLRAGSQDGFAAGTVVSAAFDADGSAILTYSNGRTASGPRIALAFFTAPQELAAAGNGGLFENRGGEEPQLGAPREGIFGALHGGSLESANVDLAQQFSELIVTQRGYQASSQVITTANEMMEQLFQISGRR